MNNGKAVPEVGTQNGDLRDRLMRLNWLQYRRFAQEISDLNLTVPQFFTLSTLVSMGGASTMGALAKQAHQVSATMTGIIDRLVRADLVERNRLEHDRRSVLVEITPVGRDLVDSAWARALGGLDTTVNELTPHEQASAYKFVNALVSSMEEAA